MNFYSILLIISLAGLIFLFALKYAENASGIIFFEHPRSVLDEAALSAMRGALAWAEKFFTGYLPSFVKGAARHSAVLAGNLCKKAFSFSSKKDFYTRRVRHLNGVRQASDFLRKMSGYKDG